MDNPIIAAVVPLLVNGTGQITEIDQDENLAQVRVNDICGEQFSGTIGCRISYHGTVDNYKVGDYVLINMYMSYQIHLGKYESPMIDMPKWIIGLHHKPAVNRKRPRSIHSASKNNTRFMHRKHDAGLLCNDDGSVDVITVGSVKMSMMPDGNGINEDSLHQHAQNFHRQISNQAPAYLAREHFGAFNAKTDEAMSAMGPSDQKIVYRRYVNADSTLERFTSTCEGAFAPFTGANNNTKAVVDTKDVVYNRISQVKDKRITIEHGAPGSEFFNMRIDQVMLGEMAMPMLDTPSPAMHGNIASVNIGSDGSVEICAGGDGLSAGNMHGLKLTYKKGEGLKVQCKEKITFTHGDSDVESNSLVMDPGSGIDLKATHGVRVNGKHLVSETLIDWIDKNSAKLCQVTMVGAPAPIHPTALAELKATLALDCKLGGYKSDGKGEIPALGLILDTNKMLFSSV